MCLKPADNSAYADSSSMLSANTSFSGIRSGLGASYVPPTEDDLLRLYSRSTSETYLFGDTYTEDVDPAVSPGLNDALLNLARDEYMANSANHMLETDMANSANHTIVADLRSLSFEDEDTFSKGSKGSRGGRSEGSKGGIYGEAHQLQPIDFSLMYPHDPHSHTSVGHTTSYTNTPMDHTIRRANTDPSTALTLGSSSSLVSQSSSSAVSPYNGNGNNTQSPRYNSSPRNSSRPGTSGSRVGFDTTSYSIMGGIAKNASYNSSRGNLHTPSTSRAADNWVSESLARAATECSMLPPILTKPSSSSRNLRMLPYRQTSPHSVVIR